MRIATYNIHHWHTQDFAPNFELVADTLSEDQGGYYRSERGRLRCDGRGLCRACTGSTGGAAGHAVRVRGDDALGC